MVTTLRDKITTYVGFDQASTEALRDARALVAPHFGSIIDDFYATVEAHPDARAAITGGSAQIARLKQSLLRWIDELFTGPHDEAYVERRLRIGRVHVRIDLPQMYMLTAMDRIRGIGHELAIPWASSRAPRTAHGGTVVLEPSEQGAVFSVRVPDSPSA